MKSDFNPKQEKYVKNNVDKVSKPPSNNPSEESRSDSSDHLSGDWSDAVHDNLEELETLLLKKKL
jgi:hypothetical protein